MKKRVAFSIVCCIVAISVFVFGILSVSADSYGNNFIQPPNNKLYVEARPQTWYMANYAESEFIYSTIFETTSFKTFPLYEEVVYGSIENGYELSGQNITSYTQVYDISEAGILGIGSAKFYANQNVMFNEKDATTTGFYDYLDLVWSVSGYESYIDVWSVVPRVWMGTYDENGNLSYNYSFPLYTEVIGRVSETDTGYSNYTTVFRSRLDRSIPAYNWYGYDSPTFFNMEFSIQFHVVEPVSNYISFGIVGGYLGVSDYGWISNYEDINWFAIYNGLPNEPLLFAPIIDGGLLTLPDFSKYIWALPFVQTLLISVFSVAFTALIIRFVINKGAR